MEEEDEEVELAQRLGLVERPRTEPVERERGDELEVEDVDEPTALSDEAEA